MIDIGSFVNFLTVFLDRTGQWFLNGEGLAHFICSGSIDSCKKIEIGMIDVDAEALLSRMMVFGLNVYSAGPGCFMFNRGKDVEIQLFFKSKKNIYRNEKRGFEFPLNWIKAPESEAEEIRRKHREMSGSGFWRRQLSEEHAYFLQLPYCYGTILDCCYPKWFLEVPKRPYPEIGDIFFCEERKKNGRELIKRLYAAAKATSTEEYVFSGFGTMLGYLMYGDFIAKDRDIDTCILSDALSPDMVNNYVNEIYKIDDKLARWEYSKRADIDKYLWVSVGYKDPTAEFGTKSCNWFFSSWNSYLWHTKGGLWVNPRKMNQSKLQYSSSDEAVSLGLPEGFIKELIEVPFGDIKIKIPLKAGSCADFWYPGWSPKGEGASAHKIVSVVGKWNDENTWRLEID